MNPLTKAVRDYLALRRGLGFKLVRHEAGLQEFVSFLARKRSSHITVAVSLEWATRHAYLTGTPELLGAAGKRPEKRWEGLNAGRS